MSARYTDMLQNYVNNGLMEYSTAVAQVLRRADEDAAWHDHALRSRFYELQRPESGPPFLSAVTADIVSSHYDLMDVHDLDTDEENPFFYLDDDGKLYLVTAGNFERHDSFDEEAPANVVEVYASSDLMANGKVVGSVYHTDH